jgi:hypothetical protein
VDYALWLDLGLPLTQPPPTSRHLTMRHRWGGVEFTNGKLAEGQTWLTFFATNARRLIEIDLYGERLSGCTVCNKWGRPGDNHRVMELLEEDLAAVRQRVQQ